MSETFDRKRYFDLVREAPFDGRLSQEQVDGQEFLLSFWEKQDDYTDRRWLAYNLATTFHETARTMQPIREYGRGKGYPYGKPCPDFNNQVGYARGYVGLTWCENYKKVDDKLNLNGALVRDFDLALDAAIAAQILFRGCAEGWFTGHKLSDYIKGSKCDYVGARRIVNGQDRASQIAGYAAAFEKALKDSAEIVEQLPDLPPVEIFPPQTIKELVAELQRITGATVVLLYNYDDEKG